MAVRRIWDDARAKVEREGVCRVCGDSGDALAALEAAHIIGRERDFYCPLDYEEGPSVRILAASKLHVHPNRIVPLCTLHHNDYDRNACDLIQYLNLDEQLQAVADCGGIEQARVRLAPSQYQRRAA
jgi:hypothetical protein